MFSSKRLTQRSLCDTPRTGHRLRAGRLAPKNGEPCQLIGIGKTLLERKLSGVFEHRVVRRSSMLFRGCDDVFRIPHSRHTTIDEEAVRAHPELKVLAESDEAGIFALSTEGGRQIFFTGHAEYDAGILNAEYQAGTGRRAFSCG